MAVETVYTVQGVEVTPAMELKATRVVTSKTLTVSAINVASFEAMLPEDETTWMSADKSEVSYVEGYQAEGIPLPKHVVEG